MESTTGESPSGRPTMATLTPLNELADAVGERAHPISRGAGGFRHHGLDEKNDSIVLVFQVEHQSNDMVPDLKSEFNRSEDDDGKSLTFSEIEGSHEADLTENPAKSSITFPFQCDVCQKRFARKHYLQRHVHVHSGQRLHQCMHCPKGFSRKDHLTQHLSSHSGELPYKCATCGKSFARRDHFKRHLVMHTGEKNFECHVCLRQFSRKDHMNKHVQVVHGISTSTAFGKDVKHENSRCKRSAGSATSSPTKNTGLEGTQSASFEVPTSTKGRGKQDLPCPRENVLPSCEISGSSTNRLGSGLGVAGSTANGQRYECSVCSKQFTTSSSLHRHGLVHSGERPFQCILCLKQFSRKYHLDRHIKVHNRVKEEQEQMSSDKTNLPLPVGDVALQSNGSLLVASIKVDTSIRVSF